MRPLFTGWQWKAQEPQGSGNRRVQPVSGQPVFAEEGGAEFFQVFRNGVTLQSRQHNDGDAGTLRPELPQDFIAPQDWHGPIEHHQGKALAGKFGEGLGPVTRELEG